MSQHDDPFWRELCVELGTQFLEVKHVSGGDICQAFQLETGRGTHFVKRLPTAREQILQAEFNSLQLLRKANEVKVPEPLLTGAISRWSYLVLEFLNLRPRSDASDTMLGVQLAALHRHAGESFGWHEPNWIGLTSQPNRRCDSWAEFFHRERLAHQVKLLERQVPAPGLLRACTTLLDRFDGIMAGHQPQPSLLHGDLWGGNYAALDGATAVIFDPASYYGDRETDLAMTRLFGGFGPAFYDAYEAAWPLPDGADIRQDLYQLYHILNHANLFGTGYVQQASRLIDRILSQS